MVEPQRRGSGSHLLLQHVQVSHCVNHIKLWPDAGPEDNMIFHHYNLNETVHGRTMGE